MFSWARDREKFMNGPFEFRVVQQTQKDPLEFLPTFWQRNLQPYVEKEEEPGLPREILGIGAAVALVSSLLFTQFIW